MQVYKAVITRRTIRRFKQKQIPAQILNKLINAGRLAPSAANLQPLEFILVNNKVLCAKVFPCLRWAGYVAPRGTPPENKRPTAYVAVLVNKSKAVPKYMAYDVAAACENIILTAWEEAIGACWMQAIDRPKLKRILKIPAGFRLDSIISLGYRDEAPKVEKFKGSIKYWLDRKGRLHIPKRNIRGIIHWNHFRK